MMNNVRKNYQNPPGSRIEDSAELLRAHDRWNIFILALLHNYFTIW